ncbi:MAG: hypothetical protein WBB37_06565 [bacterium]
MYIEGCDFGAYNSTTELFNKFSSSYINDGYPSSIGNISSISGQNNTITQGLNFEYLYQQGPDNYVDLISANGGTMIYQCQNPSGRAVIYEDPTDGYRTIYSTFIFGALRDGTNTKQDLMTAYLDYLKGN